MKVLILGASGIVGQHMRLCVPEGVEPRWFRSKNDPITEGCDLTGECQPEALLSFIEPDVVVNLAGESSVDRVEREPEKYLHVNVGLPSALARWCRDHGVRLIQISSQAVFKGDCGPYGPVDVRDLDEEPVNEYGRQKLVAEGFALAYGATVVRLNFVVGIRPMRVVGRVNPLEAMIDGQSPQVANRVFSPLLAIDAAYLLWTEITKPCGDRIIQFADASVEHSRFSLAKLVNSSVEPCAHEDFNGIAPRPVDTRYTGSKALSLFASGVAWAQREAAAYDREVELALFFGISGECALAKLAVGFGALHNAVARDFNAAPGGSNKTAEELLNWYRSTDAYIWELTAYHMDKGFNYSGMCAGIIARLQVEADCRSVLCLGDGIGDMTLSMNRAGIPATYHDLGGSRTAKYAHFRYWRQTGDQMQTHVTFGWDPISGGKQYDSIVSADFLEHVTDVEAWVRAIHASLRTGGLFFAQNAFNCGSGPDGSIPMHLAENVRFEKDWDPLLTAVGFEQLSSNWYRKL